jgi:hypothetical protein
VKRARDMAGRLHLLYREGGLVERLLEHPAQQIEIAAAEALEVQRAHFFDDALELDEVEGLAALLGISREPWQDLQLFRAWVHSQRDAMLLDGGVTVDALRGFAESYSSSFEQSTGLRLHGSTPALQENPLIRKFARPPVAADDTVPLTQFTVDVGSLDETVASFLLVGLPAAPESMPLIVNLTTGDALMFRGNVGAGQRLWLRAGPGRAMTAQLERRDVTDRLTSIRDLVPGTPWSTAQIETPAQAIRLVHGENRLWFLPVAHFDELGLDRFLLSLASLAQVQGRWDAAMFDSALFYQEPAVMLKLTWVETQPAAIEVSVQSQSIRRRMPTSGTPDQARDLLHLAIDTGVRRLKAAGIRSAVRMREFTELQRSSEFLTAVLPLRINEAGATGADRFPDKGGVFGVTDYGDSTFR